MTKMGSPVKRTKKASGNEIVAADKAAGKVHAGVGAAAPKKHHKPKKGLGLPK